MDCCSFFFAMMLEILRGSLGKSRWREYEGKRDGETELHFTSLAMNFFTCHSCVLVIIMMHVHADLIIGKSFVPDIASYSES